MIINQTLRRLSMSGLTATLLVTGIILIVGGILIHHTKNQGSKTGIYMATVVLVFFCGIISQSFTPYRDLLSNGSFETISQTLKDNAFYLNLKNLKSGKIEPYKIKYGEPKNKDMSPIEQFPPFFDVFEAEDFGHWEKDQFKKIKSVYFIIPIEKR